MTRLKLQDLIRPISRDLEAFDHRLEKHIYADSKLINSVVRHILASRGKRLRPAILFLSARGGGYYSPKLVDAALSIEVLHTATLLHDDVVDESDFRRGQLTINHKWNNLVSVLMGDYLFSRAFEIMMMPRSTELIAAMCRATGRVSFGELRQLEETANFSLDEKNYLNIIADKTASLFAIACETGPILKNAAAAVRKRYRRFGEHLGIAFQITDDLLDYVGDAEKTGKEAGSDLRQGKVTLPLIHALARSSQKVRSEITGLLADDLGKRGLNRVVKFVIEQGGIDYAYTTARTYSDRAADFVDSMKNNVYSRTLRDILQFTVSRDN